MVTLGNQKLRQIQVQDVKTELVYDVLATLGFSSEATVTKYGDAQVSVGSMFNKYRCISVKKQNKK